MNKEKQIKELKEVLRNCLDWYDEAPIEEIEKVEDALQKKFPAKEIYEVLNK